MMSMMMVALKNGVCVLKELWKLSSSLTYYVRLLLPDKKRVMSSTSCLYPVQIFGFQIVFAVVTREVSGGKKHCILVQIETCQSILWRICPGELWGMRHVCLCDWVDQNWSVGITITDRGEGESIQEVPCH